MEAGLLIAGGRRDDRGPSSPTACAPSATTRTSGSSCTTTRSGSRPPSRSCSGGSARSTTCSAPRCATPTSTGSPCTRGSGWRCCYPAANRDPTTFERPQDFDITRDPTPHLAFGHGTHFCLGANLARLEVRLLLEELVPRFTALRPVTEPDVEPNVFARAVRRFDLGFDLR